ncbi:flagellar motor switch protein FliG [Isoptericola sp. NEAU-Y5]|uniref:Flagellar motor switch protein FliG n=1 Tax=Isoptericola luteus TaxID=2879484 RepID=A0ABS7ZNB0_9MICO|nr:flagellar motor switch protein FliG [Isoptericola sp. NEAU-Y5]MCA5895134.1 flagellar motor switch protein FliG [Isoptericola sp. NEAU-Y5]
MSVATSPADATTVLPAVVAESGPSPALVRKIASMTGVQKVALVLMQMSQEHAATIMSLFSEDEAGEVAAEIMRTQVVDDVLAVAALDEFYDMALSGSPRPRGGKDFAVGLLEASLGADRAAEMVDRLVTSMQGKAFEYLDGTDPGQIVSLLDGEHPQTVALVLAHLGPHAASAVLANLADDYRTDVAQALATMGTASPDAVKLVSEQFRTRMGASIAPRQPAETVGGVQPLVDIINRADVATEKALLDGLEARDPMLAEEVRSRMLTFEDIASFDARDVQTILRGVEMAVLALAMKGTSRRVVDTITANISERNRAVLEDETAGLGGVRMSQVEEARADIVRIVRDLESEDKITIHRTEEDELVY